MAPLMLALLLGSPIVPTDNSRLLDAAKAEEPSSGVSAGVGIRIPHTMHGPVPSDLDFVVPTPTRKDREEIFSFWISMFR